MVDVLNSSPGNIDHNVLFQTGEEILRHMGFNIDFPLPSSFPGVYLLLAKFTAALFFCEIMMLNLNWHQLIVRQHARAAYAIYLSAAYHIECALLFGVFRKSRNVLFTHIVTCVEA